MEILEYTRIKKDIEKTYHFANYVTSESEEVLINKFLDTILELNSDLDRLISFVNIIHNCLLNLFDKFSLENKKEIFNNLKALLDSIEKINVVIHSYSNANKTFKNLEKFSSSLDLLKELCADIETSIYLAEDQDYNDIVNSFLA